MNSTPFFLRKALLPKALFRAIEGSGEKLFLLDCPNEVIKEVTEIPADLDFTINVPAFVLNDCVRRDMFSVWSASKRLEVEMDGDKVSKMRALLVALDFFENEGLPLRNNFGARNFSIWLTRWREAVEAVKMVLVYKVFGRKLKISDLYIRRKVPEKT